MSVTPTQWLSNFQVSQAGVAPDAKQSEITGLANGNFLVSWVEEGTTGVATSSGEDIVGQLYDSFGNETGPAFQLNTVKTIGEQDDFEVVATDDGGFILTYRSEEVVDDIDIVTERYNAAGTRIDAVSFPIGSVSDVFNPQIAFNLDSEASVTSYTREDGLIAGFQENVGARIRNSALDTVPETDLAENSSFNDENKNSIAYNTNGEIVSVYIDAATDVQLDVYSSAGVLQHTVDVDTGLDDNADPRVVTLSNGFIAVTWAQDFGGGDYDIKYKVYDSNLNVVKAESTAAALNDVEDDATMIALPGGGFVIAWDNSTSPNNGLYAQVFDNSGNKEGSVVTLVDSPIANAELGVTVDGRLLYTYTQNDTIHAGIMDPREGIINANTFNPSGQQTNFVEGNFIQGRKTATVINGDGSSETIIGHDGDDTIDGGGGSDSILGADGNDEITASGSNTTVNGGSDDDVIIIERTSGSSVAVEVDGGSGNDTLDLSDFTVGIDLDFDRGTYSATGSARDFDNFEVVIAGSGNDSLVGTFGVERLEGGGGNDTFNGGISVDLLFGGTGDDLFVVNDGHFIDDIDGGADFDTLDLSDLEGSSDAVNVDLEGNTWDGRGGSHSITGIEKVIATQGNDTVIGNFSVATVLEGEGGDDSLVGGSANDTIKGGSGNDTIIGGGGRDSLDGGANNDLFLFGTGDGIDDIDGGDGDDTLDAEFAFEDMNINLDANLHSHDANGIIASIQNIEDVKTGFGDDYIIGSSVANVINAGEGNDTLQGGGGVDRLIGGLGNDRFIVLEGEAADSIDGGDDTDTLDLSGVTSTGTGAAIDLILSTWTLNGTSNSVSGIERVIGTQGNDTISGSNFVNEYYEGQGGNDSITGEIGNETILGGTGDDTLIGSFGDDSLEGGSGNDSLSGGNHNDVINGGNNNDTILGGSGDDTLEGGDGDDLFIDNLDGGTTAINGGVNTDTLDLSGAAQGITGDANQLIGANDATQLNLISIQNLIATDFDDVIAEVGTSDNFNEISLGAGNDTLTGTANSPTDIFDGGDDIDTYIEGSSVDRNIDLLNEVGSLLGATANISTIRNFEHATGGGGNDSITGDNGDNILKGAGGNDTLVGGLGADTLDGGDDIDTASYASATVRVNLNLATGGTAGEAAGDTFTDIENVVGSGFDDFIQGDGLNNLLIGGAGVDRLRGDGGDDTLMGGAGADDMRGGSGIDEVSYADAAVRVNLNLGTTGTAGDAAGDTYSSIENVTGSGFNDYIFGNSGNNVLAGGSGDDRLRGHTGDDTLNGGEDNDDLVGGAGADSLDGGNGIDTASYAGAAARVNLNLATGGTAGDAAGDTFISIEHVLGTAHDDFIVGDTLANVLMGGAGVDRLRGDDGDDTLIGGAGADDMRGGAGIDEVNYADAAVRVNLNLSTGGTAGDALGDTFSSIENVTASDFNDYVFGTAANNLLSGGIGEDRLRGDGGDDTLNGGGDADNLIGGAGADSLDGGDGIDTASYVGAAARVNLDLRTGGTAGDAAGDTFTAIENVTGTNFGDYIYGDTGANYLSGGKGDDRLRGDGDNDTLIGGDGDDNLNGGTGADLLEGGKGEDTFVFDEAGEDTANGGEHNDVFVLRFGNAKIIDGGDGIDTLEFSNTFDLANFDAFFDLDLGYSENGQPLLGDWSNLENLIGYNKVQSHLVGNAADNLLKASIYGDTLDGEGGNDTLEARAGTDLLIGGAGADRLDGGNGRDTASYADAGARVNLDLRTAGTAGDAAGDTFISIENVIGSDFGDYLFGNAADNILEGGDGVDRLRGHTGNDTLIGGTGDDNLIGGTGADEFVFNDGDGADVVVDFQNNTDLIRLLDYGFADVAAALATATEVGSDVVFALGDGDVLTVEDITINQIANDLAIM